MKKLISGTWAHSWAYKNVIIATLLMSIATHVSFCAQPPRVESVKNAVRVLSEIFTLNEEQQKAVASSLAEIADPAGMVDIESAWNVAQAIKAMPDAPTQAGPALINKGEVEEKEQIEELAGKKKVDGGEKSKPSLDEMEVRRALMAINSRISGKKHDIKSKLFHQLGEYIASFNPLRWNILFAPGEISRDLKDIIIPTVKNTYALRNIFALQACADGSRIAFLSYENRPALRVVVWDMQKMREAANFEIKDTPGAPNAWAVAPKGDKFAFVWYTNRAKKSKTTIVDQSGKELHTITTDREMFPNIFEHQDLRFSLSGNELSLFDVSAKVSRNEWSSPGEWCAMQTTWNTNTGAETGSKKFEKTMVKGWRPYFSPDGTKLIDATNNTITVWDLATKKVLHRLTTPPEQKILHLLSGPACTLDWENRRVVTYEYNAKGTTDSFLVTRDLNTGSMTSKVQIDNDSSSPSYGTRSPIFSPDGHYLISTLRDGTTVWNLKELERQYAASQAQAAEQESKVDAESKEMAAPPVYSRRITAQEAIKEYSRAPLPTQKQRMRWENELNEWAAASADGTIDRADVWQLFEDIKNWQDF